MGATPVVFRTPHALLPFFPQFLQRRRRGYPGLAALLAETGLSRPALFLLVRTAELGDNGGTSADLRPGAPYSTRDNHLATLAEAVAAGYLLHAGGRYRLTTTGQKIVARLECEAAAYLASQTLLPADVLAQLAEHLSTIAAGLDRTAGGPQAHIHYADRLAALVPVPAAAPLVQIERAIHALWLARDDAHIGAWQIARFPAPSLSILTPLWQADAETMEQLTTLLAPFHQPDTVLELVEELIEQGYVMQNGDALQPTRAGYNIREAIESDTNDLYFRQWPALDPATLVWLAQTLQQLIAALPDTPLPAP